MRDLVCLVADKNMQAALKGILSRPQALGIRPISFEAIVHPRRDPGCYGDSPDLLRGYRGDTAHAIVLLDFQWAGREPGLRSALDAKGLWPKTLVKPPDPKRAVEWALRTVRKPRSSSIYRDVAERTSLARCGDRAFLRLKEILRGWFPAGEAGTAPSPGPDSR